MMMMMMMLLMMMMMLMKRIEYNQTKWIEWYPDDNSCKILAIIPSAAVDSLHFLMG